MFGLSRSLKRESAEIQYTSILCTGLIPLHVDRELQGLGIDFADRQIGAEDATLQAIVQVVHHRPV